VPLSDDLKALRDRLLGRGASTAARPDSTSEAEPATPTAFLAPTPLRFGNYRVLRKIGQGGMGVVYAAHDDRLERTLAVKVIAKEGTDDSLIKRFLREARAAAAVNHPHVCQLYEMGEHDGGLFIAMELLEGRSLADRVREGAMPVKDAVEISLQILSALAALHSRGLVHRDLKPSNVFLTAHGVKLLDFGLARRTAPPASLTRTFDSGLTGSALTELTQPGLVVGTPRYMAPEQIHGEEIDPRTDLFGLGAILFEMLAGRPAFAGATMVEILYATLHEQPPALTGGPAVVAVDRVIRRALSKEPAGRPATAEAMAHDLRAITLADGDAPVRAQSVTRLVVLPFRMLRPDPDTEFLSLGLADAISTSLSALGGSLVVRSSALGSRFVTEHPDLKRLAAEADVDLVLFGSLLRAGPRLRAIAQLVEAPAGTVRGAHTVEADVGDVFRLQDELSRRIVEFLELPLGRAEAPRRRSSVSARAYELFLRANHLARDYEQMPVARDLLLRCVEEDPNFAPAWARLGRAYRLIGKYIEDPEGNRARAEQAFRRALELEPELSVAHKLYAHFKAESGGAVKAMVRLLERAKVHREDAELFAGLVHACRYCGLFEASLAAHEEARRLDPHVPTSHAYTLYLKGDYERLAQARDSVIDLEPEVLGLLAQGRRDEAIRVYERLNDSALPSMFRQVADSMGAYMMQDTSKVPFVENTARHHSDPEALYTIAIFLGGLGQARRGLEILETAVRGGYFVSPALRHDPLLEPLRSEPGFAALAEAAEAGRLEAEKAFEAAGGRALLGL
jgi:serine/threonine protein kinase/tetratricopeptide (TPR) repeat protein